MLRLFFGPAPHHHVTSTGLIGHQAKKPARPLYRLVAVDEEAGRMWGALFASIPEEEDFLKVMVPLLSGRIEGCNATDVVIPAKLDAQFSGLADLLAEHNSTVWQAASGFHGRIHLVKKWDEYVGELSHALYKIREGMVTVDEFMKFLATPHGWCGVALTNLSLLRQHGLQKSGWMDQHNLTAHQAAAICKARGRNPEVGAEEITRHSRAPLNDHAHAKVVPDMLAIEVAKLGRDASSLTDLGTALYQTGRALIALRAHTSEERRTDLEKNIGFTVSALLLSESGHHYYGRITALAFQFSRMVGNGTPDAINLARAVSRYLADAFPAALIPAFAQGATQAYRAKAYWIEISISGETDQGPWVSVVPRHTRVVESMAQALPGVRIYLDKDLRERTDGSVPAYQDWGWAAEIVGTSSRWGTVSEAPKSRWVLPTKRRAQSVMVPMVVLTPTDAHLASFEARWAETAQAATAVMMSHLSPVAPHIAMAMGRLQSFDSMLSNGAAE